MWYKDGNKSGCNIYIFFMTKVLCSGRCYKHVLATGGSNSPTLQKMSATSAGPSSGHRACGQAALRDKTRTRCLPQHVTAMGRLGATAEEEAMVDRVENAAGMQRRLHAEASLDAAEEVPVPGLLLLFYLSSAISPSSFCSRGLSTLRSLCSVSPNLFRSPGLSVGTAYSLKKSRKREEQEKCCPWHFCCDVTG